MGWHAATMNIGRKIAGRVLRGHKPFVRNWKRCGRVAEQFGQRRQEWQVTRDIARGAGGTSAGGTIVVGPWLGEVGYEVLYWIPFLNWLKDRYQLTSDQLVVVTRGGAGAWYGEVTRNCVEIFDHLAPTDFARLNEERREQVEGGGQKHTGHSALDREILDRIGRDRGVRPDYVIHPSLMFRLFKQFWLGNRSLEFVLHRTRCLPVRLQRPEPADLPREFVAVKFYSGRALPDTPDIRRALTDLVQRLARRMPVVVLDTGLELDEHSDYAFEGLTGVTSFRGAMTPRDNLAIQADVIQRASLFVGTCGSVAWLAPMLGVPTVAVYADDRLLTSHLYFSRHAYRLTGAAPFTTVDVRATRHVDAAAACLHASPAVSNP